MEDVAISFGRYQIIHLLAMILTLLMLYAGAYFIAEILDSLSGMFYAGVFCCFVLQCVCWGAAYFAPQTLGAPDELPWFYWMSLLWGGLLIAFTIITRKKNESTFGSEAE